MLTSYQGHLKKSALFLLGVLKIPECMRSDYIQEAWVTKIIIQHKFTNIQFNYT